MSESRTTPFRIAITETYVREVEIYAPDEASAHQIAETLCYEGVIELEHNHFADRYTECRGTARPIDLELHDVFSIADIPRESLDSIVQSASTRTEKSNRTFQERER